MTPISRISLGENVADIANGNDTFWKPYIVFNGGPDLADMHID
jgi:hypothetical protein